MIKSDIGMGKIYAGDTLLECSFGYEQTGPLEITIKPGHLRTTGQSRIINRTPATEQAVQDGDGEEIDAARVRIWLKKGGKPQKSKRFEFKQDHVVKFLPHPTGDTLHWVCVDVGGKISYGWEFLPFPDGLPQMEQLLVFPFVLPAGASELPDVFVFTVEPGFPLDTTSEDWAMQSGYLPG